MVRLLFAQIALLVLGLASSATAITAPSTRCDERTLSGVVTSLARAKNIPGVAVAVSSGSTLLWSFGYGLANLEDNIPVSPERSRFRLGSTSKALTAFGLMRLVDQRRINIDAPIERYVPSVAHKGMTARLLGGHLAGIRHYRDQSELANQARYPTITASLDLFIQDPLVTAPGAKFHYSTYGYTLLSAAMESAANDDFLGYMSEAVFKPLTMGSTVPDDATAIVPGRTGFYYLDGGELRNGPYVDSSYKWAGAGFLSTAVDLVRFGAAHFDEALLSESSREVLWSPQHTSDGTETSYGLGWFTYDGYVEHPGGIVGGSALLRIYKKEKLVIAILGNLSILGDDPFGDTPDRLYNCFSK